MRSSQLWLWTVTSAETRPSQETELLFPFRYVQALWQCFCRNAHFPHITNSKEQGPSWEADGQLPVHKTEWFVNSNSHCHIHKRQPLYPIPKHMNSVHKNSYFFKTYFNIILPSKPRFLKLSLSFRFYRLKCCFSRPMVLIFNPIESRAARWTTIDIVKPNTVTFIDEVVYFTGFKA